MTEADSDCIVRPDPDRSVLPLLKREEQTIAGVLRAHGVDSVDNQGLHGWRCRYPESYGPCACFDDLVADLERLVTQT